MLVVQAPDAATSQSDWARNEAQAQSLATINALVICALKGSFFVAITDTVSVGQVAPTANALEGQMATTLGRLP